MKLQVFVAALASFAFTVTAHPSVVGGTQPEHALRKRLIASIRYKGSITTTYVKSDDVGASNEGIQRRDSYVDTAADLVRRTLPDSTFRTSSDHYVGTNGVGHVYLKQTANGLDVDNADFNVNINNDGSVLSFGYSFFEGEIPAESHIQKRSTDPVSAVASVSETLQLSIDTSSAHSEPVDSKVETYAIKGSSGAVKDPVAKLVYFQTKDSLQLAWRVETDLWYDWLVTYVDARDTTEIFGVVNHAAEASYNVYPWSVNDPSRGDRSIVIDPSDTITSEFGWHSNGTNIDTTTYGNNGIALPNLEGNLSPSIPQIPRPDGGSELVFDYPYSPEEADFAQYSNASVTQLFYTANMCHDLYYLLGFTERAGNFELNNNGQGGIDGDHVVLTAQDGFVPGNAAMLTPVEGQRPRMFMGIFTRTSPPRDSSFDAGVVIHEYTHGLSTRLTGGPTTDNCLPINITEFIESGGMGEGWSDFYPAAIAMRASDTRVTDYVIGPWLTGQAGGFREVAYSTNMTTNPLTYNSVNLQHDVTHRIGTTWCSMLYEILWNLIDKHGITDDERPTFDANGVPTDGRYLAMKIVLDGMTLQPCRPSFVQARDAILDADRSLTGGDNICEIWTGFAKRGLGANASRNGVGNNRIEDFTIPVGVC